MVSSKFKLIRKKWFRKNSNKVCSISKSTWLGDFNNIFNWRCQAQLIWNFEHPRSDGGELTYLRVI